MHKARVEVRVLYLALVLLFVVFLLLPLGGLLVKAFTDGKAGGMTLENFQRVFARADFLSSLSHSFVVSALAGFISTALAFGLAYAVNMARLPRWLRAAIPVAIAVPALIPTITYGFAIIYTFGKQGLITRALGGHQLFSIYGIKGLLLGYVIYTLPVAYLLIDNGFRYVDKHFYLVSRIMGDRALPAFFRQILVPLLTTIGASFVQGFALSFADFGIPASVGGRYNVLAKTLYETMLGAIPSFERGAVVALAMLLPSVLSVLLLTWLERFTINHKKISTVTLRKNRPRDVAFGLYSVAVLTVLLSIFAVVFIVPFVKQWPWDKSLSFDLVVSAFTTAQYRTIGLNSLLFSGLTACTGTLLTFCAGLVARRGKLSARLTSVLDSVSIATNSIPGMVLGVAYLLFFVGTPLQNTLFIMVACTTVHLFSTPFLMFAGAFSRMNSAWEVTAGLMGDRWFQTLRRILIPNVLSTICEVFGYYFIYTMVTISGVVFLVSAYTMLLTTKINQLAYFARFDDIFVLSLAIFVINLLARLLTKIGARRAQARLVARSEGAA